MYRILLILLILASTKIYSYNSIGLSLGPDFGIKGSKVTSFMLNMDWNPHEHIGTRFLVNIDDSFWLGTALTFIYQTSEKFSKNYNWRANFSIPLLLKIKNNDNLALLGFAIGNSFALSIDKRNKYFFFITPLEIMIYPVTWRMTPVSDFEKQFNIYCLMNAGIRMKI